MSLRSPLSRVLGSGSAREGTDHWWQQRVSAVGLVLLGAWFLGLAEGADDVWALSVDSREERPATALAGRPGRLGLAGLAIDQGYLYFTWQEPRGDIWVADLLPARGR